VIYGLANLYPDEPPHVVLSGINQGQNVGNVGTAGFASQVSGTVGAAKTAACADVPALASSQGHGETINYPSGVEEVLRWLEDNRAALFAGQVAVENITSINIPSCDTGKIRGRLQVSLATENPNDYNLVNGDQDCESTLENPPNDIEAFYNGFTSIAPVPRNSNMTCDKLD
jgi:5'-nucleotidase